ncbi:MAG: aldo/keto reductase [Acidobacteriia bacterium]|nr:aldo/keto reductase [Terriglobia bacterium]
MTGDHSRRDFLGKVALGIAGASVGLSAPERVEAAGEMPYRTLGRSGEKVSIVGLGGFHLGKPKDEAEVIRIVRTAIDNGINFMDNCWDYHGGVSEERMGKALRDGYRQKVFLMTKTDGQVKEAWNRQLEDSLRRLQTDVIDLVQFHEVIRMGDPDRIFGANGAFEAAVAARKAGKIRYIGFTGHKDPDIHLKMLETSFQHGFTFDTAQMPLNVMDAHYKSFEQKVLPVLLKHGIGVLGMKPLAFGNILKSNTATPIECLHYAMNLPTSVVIAGCESLKDLDQALEAARTFRPLGREEVAALLAKTASAAKEGQFEPFKSKSTTEFDTTDHNPAWLG